MNTLLEIVVGARSSPLSRKQVEEVYAEIKAIHPHVVFKPIFVETVGDRDKKTSLRTLERTDFFTKDIDRMLLEGKCRMGVHSGKDLPEPLPKGLILGAMTKGVDPSDVLVLREGETLSGKSVVATSSERREQCVAQLFPQVRFVDIRGTIQERLEKLWNRTVDGVVIAEAALIRLGLTHLHRIKLSGETAPMQGRLACIIREEDVELASLLRGLN